MQKQTALREEFERHLPRTRPASLGRSLKKLTLAALAAVCAVSVAAAALILFYDLANPPVQPGQEVFIRDFYIFLDHSGTMKSDIPHADDIIVSRIFPLLGPGDRVFLYQIDSGFLESRNRVFEKGALPGVPENLLDLRRAKRIPPEEVTALWGQVEDVIKEWTEQLKALSRSPGKRLPGSNYLDAFSYTATRVKAQDSHHIREIWLIVIGDLFHEPKPRPFRPPDPSEGERNAFKGVEVRLIYPYRSQRPQHIQPGPDELRRFWNEYFSKRGNDQVQFRTFDDPTPPLRESPVLKPPKDTMKSATWEAFLYWISQKWKALLRNPTDRGT